MPRDTREFTDAWFQGVASETIGGTRQMLGTSLPPGAMKGKPIMEMGRDVCAWLQWATDNDDEFEYRLALELGAQDAYYRLRIYDKETMEVVHTTKSVPIRFAGVDGSGVSESFARALRGDIPKLVARVRQRILRRIERGEYTGELTSIEVANLQKPPPSIIEER